MNLVLTLAVIAGTYTLACLLLSALGRLDDKAEREPRPDVTV